ncbi:hypothetical protein CYLTODRAFT_353102 [Cylindrobasidium torrendii FP15055 ss-10]|uniref:Uncharacterized protein n=1 Tax=Cylindrobasidium torrendii FP15055 ss-10 TaxID=1314674 RepID=A0A0D7BD85_9AGAR|nr:hypothetical protein CYLTODRAFT_353102 [Cylindrobasidium torrendii FP15055 ss-10]
MFPTRAVLSKASRAPLTSKRGPKDYYKGNRQSYLPGGLRTGPPGKHVIRGKAKYRIDDTKVRVFVAPSQDKINNSLLKPYVARNVYLSDHELLKTHKPKANAALPSYWAMGPGGLTAEHYLKVMRDHNKEEHEQVGEPAETQKA